MGRKFLDYLKVFFKCFRLCFFERGFGFVYDRDDDVRVSYGEFEDFVLEFGVFLSVLLFVVLVFV